jgi:type II secretion system protein N
MKFTNIVYVIIIIPLFFIFVWLFAVPTDLIHEKIEDSISNTGNADIQTNIKGLRKGLFLTLYADSLRLNINKAPALQIKDIVVRFNPKYLIKWQLAFSIKGKIGTGDINGLYKLPNLGEIKIDNAELNAIPYWRQFGIEIDGDITSHINVKNDTIRVTFKVPNLDIQDSFPAITPFMNTFRRMQGAVSLKGNTIIVDSISLEGEKGYARLKGDIRNGFMNLVLELMPAVEKLDALESMLIGKYMVSPGYYIIPVEGPLL